MKTFLFAIFHFAFVINFSIALATPVRFHLNASDIAYAVARDSDGKYVVAGQSGSGTHFGVLRLTNAGNLDPGFGSSGTTTFTMSGSAGARAIAIQSDGKIVLVGNASSGNAFGVIRILSSGALDTTFSGDGKLEIPLSGSASAEAVQIQSDGKIVIAGGSSSGNAFGVVRVNSNGSLDTSFSSDGKTEVFLSGSSRARDLAILSDGKIVVAGGSSSGNAYGFIRLLANGSIDTSFGSSGTREVFVSGSSAAHAIKIQNDGKIVAVGESSSGNAFGLVRLTANGNLDTGFGSSGIKEFFISGSAGARDLAIQSDGRIIVVGHSSSGNGIAIIRVNANGTSLDSSFGNSGIRELFPSSPATGESVVLESSGKILLVGGAGGDFVIEKLLANGTSDSSFPSNNSPPRISTISNQNIFEDNASNEINFTVADDESPTASLTLTKSSSDTTLIPNANIVLGGSGANRTVTITPAANQNGTTTITLTVSDGTISTSTQFVLTVSAINDAPTLTNISNQTISEDTPTGALTFTISDVETSANLLTLTKSSSNTTLVPTANIVFGGAGANRNVTITPAANQNGTTTITLTVSDGSTSTSKQFALTISAVNDAPTMTNISNQTTGEDIPTAPISFTIADAETSANLLTLTKSSSNTTLVPTANIVFGGSGSDRTVTITPEANQNGTTTITLTVSDGFTSTSKQFLLTVSAINDVNLSISATLTTATTTTAKYTVVTQEAGSATLRVYAQTSPPSLLGTFPVVSVGIGTHTFEQLISGLTQNQQLKLEVSFISPSASNHVAQVLVSTNTFTLGSLKIIHEGKTFYSNLPDEIGDSSFVPPPANNWTMSFWVAPQSVTKSWFVGTQPGQDFVAAEAGGTSQFVVFPTYIGGLNIANAGIAVGTDRICVFEHRSNSFPCVINAPLNLNNACVHVVLKYENRVPTVYVDGTLVAVGQIGPATNIIPTVSEIGGGAYGHLNGQVSDIRIYNRPLSQAEIVTDRDTSIPENSISGLVYRFAPLAPPVVSPSNANQLMKLKVTGLGATFIAGSVSHPGLQFNPTTQILSLTNHALVAKYPTIAFTIDGTLNGNQLTRAFFLNVASSSFSRYTHWLGSEFSDAQLLNTNISSDVSDPDGDGLANIVEYVTGNHALTRSANPLTIEGRQFRYYVDPQSNDVSQDVLFISTDLVSWGRVRTTSVEGNLRIFNSPISMPRLFGRLSVD